MTRSKYNHRFVIGLAVLTAGFAIVGASSPNKSIRKLENPSQNLERPRTSTEKYLGKYAFYPNEPVLVTDLVINGTPRELNRKVTADEDWLNGLRFKVKNTSNKNIVFIYVSLVFPEAKVLTGTLFAFDLLYGADQRLEGAVAAQKPIKPEEDVEFVLSDASYQNLKRGIEARITPIKNINAVQIDVVRVIFDDDTAWATGSFMHRDPNNPKRWIDNE